MNAPRTSPVIRYWLPLMLVLLGSILIRLELVYAQEPTAAADADPKQRADAFLIQARDDAASYGIRGESSDDDFVLADEPILRWSNPEIGEIYGGVFLWTRDGRPRAVASMFKWYSPFTHCTHEFQSLSTEPISADRSGETVWTASKPGVEFQPVPGAPAPAGNPGRRLAQMRDLARRFSAAVIDAEHGTRGLRLLSQPLYRYGGEDASVADGALFGFVLGTDPEVLLMLEMRRDAGGDPRWEYALARLEFLELEVTLGDESVWSAAKLSGAEVYRGQGTYVKFQFDEPEPAGSEPTQ
jgi:hypothetical protein